MYTQQTKNKDQKNSLSVLACRTGRGRRGFTVIEIMVAVALFAIVMVISAQALLSLASANRKAQALQSVMNNLNTTLDSMVRSMREGSTYHCGSTGSMKVPLDCPSGDIQVAFEPYGGNPATNDQRAYRFVAPSGTAGGYIQRSLDGGTNWVRVTAQEISIVDMKFYVVGTTPGDTTQPKIVMEIKGTADSANTQAATTFHIQSTAVQRILDI